MKWPAAGTVAGKGNSGVAGIIKNTPGSIGYLNYGYVKGSFQQAAIQNKAGNYVRANAETSAAGLYTPAMRTARGSFVSRFPSCSQFGTHAKSAG